MATSSGTTTITNTATATESFTIWQTDHGTYPTASTPTSTMDLTSSDASITITGNSSTDTINFQVASPFTPGTLSSPTTGVSVSGGVSAVNGSGTTISIQTASGSQPGLLSAADWTTFNGKQSALTLGNLTDTGTDGITVTGGTGAIIGSGASIAQHVADASHNGYLLSTDWTTFNNKQATISVSAPITLSGATVGITQSTSGANGYLSSTDWTTFNTGASNAPDPVNKLYLFDDFYLSATNIVGTIGWKSALAGTGSPSAGVGVSFAGHPGVLGLNTGTATTGFAQIYLGDTAAATLLSDGAISWEMLIDLTNLSDGTNTYTVYAGMFTGIAGSPTTDGLYFSYTNGTNSGKWLLNVLKASVDATSDSGVTVTTGWTKLKFTTNAAGSSVTFSINGSSVGTVSSSLPTAGIQPALAILKSAGGTNRPVYIDYFRMTQTLATPRA